MMPGAHRGPFSARRLIPTLMRVGFATAVVAMLALPGVRGETASARHAQQAAAERPSARGVFPMAVWYGGGTARAPMLERNPRAKKDAWRRDLQQIRALGFTAIRCWMDWASGEPAPGRYTFD